MGGVTRLKGEGSTMTVRVVSPWGEGYKLGGDQLFLAFFGKD